MKTRIYLLHELSWTDIESLNSDQTVFLIPVGSTEQHGPQNPLGTDFLIAEYIARTAAKQSQNAICLPTVPIGVASHHRNFSGTLWIPSSIFEEYIKSIIRSLHHHKFSKIIVVNGHGGNSSALMNSISHFNDYHDMTCLLFEWWKDEELIKSVFNIAQAIHADAIETSVVWATRPDLARKERLEGLTSSSKWGREIGELYLSSRTDQFTSTGIAGSLEGISIEKGQEVLNATIKKLLNSIILLSNYK